MTDGPTDPGGALPVYQPATAADDGTWSVLVMTQKGDCDPGYRYPIRIANGQLVNAGDSAFTITGKVADTVVPLPSRLSMRSAPPSSSTRSRIKRNPRPWP